MSIAEASSLAEFVWHPQPHAAGLVAEVHREFLVRCPFAQTLAQRMSDETGTRLIDWIDHFSLPDSDELRSRLAEVGFVEQPQDGLSVWRHPDGMFPRMLLQRGHVWSMALRVESVTDCLAALGRDNRSTVQGSHLAPFRTGHLDRSPQAELWCVERHGYDGFSVQSFPASQLAAVLRHAEAFKLRRREFDRLEDGFGHAMTLIDAAVKDLGAARACDLFFAAERDYWQRRNRAGRLQKARQDRLGLGWGNHDHHTYRSSRECFHLLVTALRALGFECRERFYAGREAGWGAQVLEQHQAGITIFADVDMSPEELSGDFPRLGLPARSQLGTVGLWCKLHGEAFLEAGMHHLEAQFDFDAARRQLQADGVNVMKPFTDFPYLRQAFTEGERWQVSAKRIDAALAQGSISAAQAEQFRRSGALGSHLEILQRDDGYKGFNQQGINEIIQETDPRRHS